MKNFNKIFFAAVAAAFGLVSCSQELTPVEKPQGNLVTVNFGAEASITCPTKATLTTEDEKLFTSAWENGDVLSVEYISPETADNKIITATWNGTSFVAKGLPNETGAWDYTACYPKPDENDNHIDFGANRTQKGNAYNSIYDVMIGNKSTKNSAAGKDDDGSDIVFNMKRQTAVAYFHLTGGPAEEQLVSATLSVEGGFIASQHAYISNFAFAPSQDLNEITITFDEGTAPKASDFQLWFNVLPTNYTKMTLTVETTGHKLTLNNKTAGEFKAENLYKTVLTPEAGKWIPKGGDTPTQTSYAWDLSIDSTSEASAECIGWTSNIADMLCVKAKNGTDANNYYPGSNNCTSTRFYSGSTLSITPKSSISLYYYIFVATTENYAQVLADSEWTNAKAEIIEKNKVYIVATDPTKAVSAKISGTCGFSMVECHADALSLTPVIETTSSPINVAAEGGEKTISYTILHPITGSVLTATTTATWIKSINCESEGLISFVVNPNEGEERSATIILSYPEASTVAVSIKQKAKGAVSETKYFEKVTSTPTDWSGKYLIVFGKNARSYVATKGEDLISKNANNLSIIGDKIESNATVNVDMVEISKTTNGYKILLSDGQYLSVPASNACGANNTGSVFTITLGTKGVSISGVDSKNATRTLCNNGSYYRMYTNVGSYNLPQLYKLAN